MTLERNQRFETLMSASIFVDPALFAKEFFFNDENAGHHP